MDYTNNPAPTSTFNIVFNGTANQTIIDTGNGIFFPGSITVNKSSGALSLWGSLILLSGNWTNDDATSTVSASTSLVRFFSTSATISGSTNFYRVGFGGTNATQDDNFTVATGTILNISSSTFFYPIYTAIYLSGGGEVDVQGSVFLAYPELMFSGQPTMTNNFKLVLNGTGTQLVSDQGYSNPGSEAFLLQGLTVNKPSGVAAISSADLLIPGNLSVLQGELQLSTGVSPEIFQVDGTTTISSGAVLSDYPITTSTLVFGGSVTNNGTVFFDGSGGSCVVSSTAYVVLNSTTTGQPISWSGSGNFIMRYTNVADQTGTAVVPVWNGVASGTDVGSNWHISSGNPEPELVQTSTAVGGSGTTQTSTTFGFKPRAGDLVVVAVSARNQTIATPTDDASNTYTLVASSTFGSSPSYALSLYYAKNITPSSSFTITVKGNGGTGPFLSASVFEYTGINPSSTFDTSSMQQSGPTTALSSFTANGQSINELFLGALTFSASTTATSGSGWTPEAGITNNNTTQALYTEDVASTSQLSLAATWTSATSTNYAAMLGVFHGPYQQGYVASGTLDSATFDTGVPGGVQLNSFIWQGSTPSNSNVRFQFAVSNSSSGPWNFEGPDGSINTYFGGTGTYGVPINLQQYPVNNADDYALFSGGRYYRYRVRLDSDPTYTYTPVVTQVSVNWSP
jgi:hypothetical protein